MSQPTRSKKISSLESIVGKLSRDVAVRKLVETDSEPSESSVQDGENAAVEEPTVIEEDIYLGPSTSNPSSPPDSVVLSAPASPSGSGDNSSQGDQSDTREDAKQDKKGRKSLSRVTIPRKRSSLGGFIAKVAERIPKDPMRCDVCGLRVYKSYRYISRTSAPLHLKRFVTPSVDRFRVCKRCFSSRERCRQNLALILLKSQTSQMVHLRTPLGVTDTRATQGMQYIMRDLKHKLKRPYDDLMCDETLLDEDEMSNEDFDEKDKISQPGGKVAVLENGKLQPEALSPLSSKATGMVTLVRPQSGVFSSTPNYYTLYSEASSLKKDVEQSTDSGANAIQPDLESGLPDEAPEAREQITVNGGLSTEINTINNKLTLLDHAYALPPPKSRGPTAKVTGSTSTVAKPTKTAGVKVVVKGSPSKSAGQTIKKEPSDEKLSPSRTCGIVCTLCDNLVTKSYSCYKKDNAPEKVQHLFKDGMKVVKVCRRCCPYKKPKVEDEVKANKKPVKPVKGKIVKVKKSGKIIKVLKTTNAKLTKMADSGKAKPGKVDTTPQDVKPKVPGNSVKNGQSNKKEIDKKVTDKAKSSIVQVCSAGSQTDKAASKGSAKEITVETSSPGSTVDSKPTPMNVKEERVTEKDCKAADTQQADSSKSNAGLAKGKVQPAKAQGADKVKGKEEAELAEGTGVTKCEAPSVESTDKLGKKTECAGIQAGCSLIGVRMKSKANKVLADKDGPHTKEKADAVSSKMPATKKEISTRELDSLVTVGIPVGGSASCKVNADLTGRTPAAVGGPVHTCTVRFIKIKREKIDNGKVEANGAIGEVKEEAKQALQGKDKGNVQKCGTAAKDAPKEEVVKKENGGASGKCKPNEPAKNEATAAKCAENKTKEKAEPKNEVPPPRKGRNASTPERRKDSEKAVVPTIMTRKRLASLSEVDADVAKQVAEEPVVKRRALAVPGVQVTNSAESNRSMPQTSSGSTEQGENNSQTVPTESSEIKSSSQTTASADETENGVDNGNTDEGANKLKPQTPVECAVCNHRVVKSYRCLQRDASPGHVKPLFKDPKEILRICRRCLKPGHGKYRS